MEFCLIGLGQCRSMVSVISAGHFLPWSEALGIAGIIFIAFEFMEANKMRYYLSRFGKLLDITIVLVWYFILLVVTANIIPFVATDPYIPLLSYLAFYELLALAFMSLLLITYVIFLLRPKFFLNKLNPGLLVKFKWQLFNNLSDESLDALSRLLDGGYMETLVKEASRAKRSLYRMPQDEISDLSAESLRFIDVDLSTPLFVRYIARNNLRFVLNFFNLAEENELWEAGGGIFVDRLCEALFTDEESLLSKEHDFGGISGIEKPITNTLFKSSGLLSHYRVFNVLRHWSPEITPLTLENWGSGLEVAIKYYYSEERSIYYSGTPNNAISDSLERIGESTQWIVSKLNKYKDDGVWDNEYASKVSIIGRFFQSLIHILIRDDPSSVEKPVFSEQELKTEKGTVAEGISKGLFAYIEAFTWMKNEEVARMYVIQPMWLVFNALNTGVVKGIRKKVLSLIKERFEENYKSHYASMIKLMLVIYSVAVKEKRGRSNIIERFVGNEFRTKLADLFLKNKKFREEHMPENWFISPKGDKIYRSIYGKRELLYPIKKKKKARKK